MFAYIQDKHFKLFHESNSHIETLNYFSDGCGYQNRNNMYLDLAMRRGVTIQQYLVSGHTQMECDSMHSTIERKLTSDIFTPRDYVTIFQAACTTPTQYCVSKITFDEIHKLSEAM